MVLSNLKKELRNLKKGYDLKQINKINVLKQASFLYQSEIKKCSKKYQSGYIGISPIYLRHIKNNDKINYNERLKELTNKLKPIEKELIKANINYLPYLFYKNGGSLNE
jgi:hypothetical protein